MRVSENRGQKSEKGYIPADIIRLRNPPIYNRFEKG